MRHTPAPWETDPLLSAIEAHDPRTNGIRKKSAVAYTSGYFGLEAQKANAQRIVACVNACEGITTEALTAESYINTASYTMRKQAEQQRDELLESLTDILARFESCIDGGNGEQPDDALAIAKAKAAIKAATR